MRDAIPCRPQIVLTHMVCSTLCIQSMRFTTERALTISPSTLGKRRIVKKHRVAQPVVINMSARSSSKGVQAALESKMISVHKNVVGAPVGKTNVIFVDDVNLPARDAFDSQPPVELLRQLVSVCVLSCDERIMLFLAATVTHDCCNLFCFSRTVIPWAFNIPAYLEYFNISIQ